MMGVSQQHSTNRHFASNIWHKLIWSHSALSYPWHASLRLDSTLSVIKPCVNDIQRINIIRDEETINKGYALHAAPIELGGILKKHKQS